MDLYTKKSRWKWYLTIMGIVILIFSTIYTNYLAQQLSKEELLKVEQWRSAILEVSKEIDDECVDCVDYTYFQQRLSDNTTIPVIMVDRNDNIAHYANFSSDDSLYLAQQLIRLKSSSYQPLQDTEGNLIYYENSSLYRQLQYFPLIQLGLIGVFILFGYLAFSSARRAQENQVWVGMAKETAHQLGTPTSAIVGWIEHLKYIREDDEEVQEVVQELRNDVTRLELVADRFSKIGSEPELKKINVYEELEKCRRYMQRRAPRKVHFTFPDPAAHVPKFIDINPPLFDWVIENLMRNALDAMNGKGEIKADVFVENDMINIDLSDTGSGIPSGKFKSIFQPGYTTKKRGWGLGLSLAKRIIEKYHTGKIFVKKSEENRGTTFTIQLPEAS